MASIVLGVVGSAVTSATGAPFFKVLGSRFGQSIGNRIDNLLLSPTRKLRPLNGPRLADLGVQTSTYGKMIPVVYGSMRIAGNIIWSLPIKETITTSTSSAGGIGKGGGGKVSQTSTTYSYSVTLAIGICAGPIDEVLRIWADAKQLDLSQFTIRIYKGDEQQLPDTLIQSIEGAGNTPAFRGLAYVVLEDFPMTDYGNRIPNFTFEVRKKTLHPDYNGETLEDMITGMVMIPGGGEFVYDTEVAYKVPGALVGSTWVQQGSQQAINMHNAYGIANAMLSLDQLEKTCPNIEWVSVVVSWFGDNMDAGQCTVLPGVEYKVGAVVAPADWQVAGFTRSLARLITQIEGSPQYGGTPDDNSIVRYVSELKVRGYKVAFYPLLFVDVSGKPWRGDLTGNASDVSSFFTKTNGYNAFITHYANLLDGEVDAFIIGSELKGLTKVTDTPGNYPAVNELISLAATVKSILGSTVKVTYAADWSEYHHTDGGWYNLDPLWASADIDVIGIDAYFPLTNEPQSGYDVSALINGWTSGEGYDWYYSDPERTNKVNLSAPYAWKNIDWFWNNTHTNPDSNQTGWVPQSKKIWFTEYGYPSVDGASNQPNVFYDPSSASSAFPYFSRGRVDFLAQRAALTATQQKWKNSTMIEQMFVWTWDARPFPYWPDLTGVWSDGINWKTGHWVQGKLGTSSLAAIISDLCINAGFSSSDIDVGNITAQVDGIIISTPQTFRDTIEMLQSAYFFDVVESDNMLKFIPRGQEPVQAIMESDIAIADTKHSKEAFVITRSQEIKLPKRVNVVFITRLFNYQSAMQYSQREVTSSLDTLTIDLPLVCSEQTAKNIADITLFTHWMGRTEYEFALPLRYMQLEPSDVITVSISGITHRMRIVSIRMEGISQMHVTAVAEDDSTFDFYTAPATGSTLLQGNNIIPVTTLELLDLPGFPGDDADKGVLRAAACGLSGKWTGTALYRSDDGGMNYTRVVDMNSPSAIGKAINALAGGPTAVFDDYNTVTVLLLSSAELQSVTQLAVLNGANAAIIGNEVLQFTTATLIEPNKYMLSGLLRGRLGTEWATSSHLAGERFVLLDGSLGRINMANNIIGLNREYKPVSYGATLPATSAQGFTYTGIALKPYNPVHITGIRDSSGNLTLNWVRRTRLGGEWQDGTDVPLNEALEAYEVDIIVGSTVKRTIAGLGNPNATYTVSEQTSDFGSPQSSIVVDVYQISGIIGRGYAARATV